MRQLTDFEREHGYSPCPFTLGDAACGVLRETIDAMAPVGCDGEYHECQWWGNEARFGGQPVPGGVVGLMLRGAWAKAKIAVDVEEGALDE